MPKPDELSPADAASFETSVVPRYLSLFGDLALELLVSGPAARVLHVGCRTGYPNAKLVERIAEAEVIGLDTSTSALEVARQQAQTAGHERIHYKRLEALPGDLEPGVFTHTLALHPVLDTEARSELFSAMRWLLCPGGQAIVAMPLRGSFQEITDLFREYALKYDDEDFARELDASLAERPSLETLSDQLEAAGLDDVDVEVRQVTIPFDSGRAFVDDPVSRLLILPEVRSWLPLADTKRPLEYVRDAIDRYWSESKLELSLNVGAASARCP